MTGPPATGVRIAWTDLPPQVKAAVERICGAPVVAATTQPGGFSPGVAARVVCSDGSRHFVKAVSGDANADSPGMHRREAQVLTALGELNGKAGLSADPALPIPVLHGWAEVGSWVALVLQDIEGNQPPLPWRPDHLDRVLAAVEELNAALTPAPITAPTIADLHGRLFTGWRRLATEPRPGLDDWSREHLSDLAALEATWETHAAGDTLLHSDLRADNLLLTADRVVVVDWPHACVGSAYVDVVLLAPSVTMQGGPPPWEVQARTKTGKAAPDMAVAAMVCAIAGYLTERALRPAPPGLPTLRAFQAAQGEIARRWLAKLI